MCVQGRALSEPGLYDISDGGLWVCSDVGEALLTSFSACTYILFHKAAKATNTKRW